MKKIFCLLMMIITLSSVHNKSDNNDKDTVLDLLWSSQRGRLLKWAYTLKLVLKESLTSNNFFIFSDDDLRKTIKDIITQVNSYEIDRLNRNPEKLDQLSEELGVNRYISQHPIRPGRVMSTETIPTSLRNTIDNMPRDKLIELIKAIDIHIKKGRDYLAEGVLASLDKMTEGEMKEWIFRKLEYHHDLTRLEILK